ncbi:metalloregulator ArsR/SmtB family transcription factor [Pontibacter sp. E15-1]|uniref:ArsR/SmtB family transcription factor n=1 Tax=Pontibacter sp. E15-1 TaxID=2919918 RepID=UPI001F503956|nr:metalloregulator ArsR/SmtB family transcription factor [Pontibacter sp. E15-1]MCJ8166034.1 metalloregulator ArsR/SmtB family transcription factor [Pontibacter sp. E15-1]
MKNQGCIRVLADENQIKQCKQDIAGVEGKVRQMAGMMSLAGNAVRLNILFLLYKEEQMCPCDLSDVLEMTVPAISQHLRKLKDGGLVKDKKVGQTVFYSAVEENIQLILPLLKELTASSEQTVE